MIYPNSKRFLPIYKIDYSKMPLTFKSLDGNGYVKFGWMNFLTAYYSVNDGQWQSYNQEKVYFSNKGDTVAFSGIASNDAIHDCSFDLDVYITGIQKRVQVYGNLASINLRYSGDTWQSAFSEQLNLVDASKLVLGQNKQDMYASMFWNCASLTAAPEILNQTVYSWCYWRMFEGCKKLISSPYLPATELAQGCYCNMFKGCTSLTSVNVNFTNWTETINATENWVQNVSPTGVFTKPSALSTAYGNWYIPQNWTVINK